MDAAAKSQLKEALLDHSLVVFAYLFGSEAKERQAPRADVDIAVWLREPIPAEVDLELQGRLCRVLKRDDVDLIVLNTAPLTLAFEAFTGQLLASKDEGIRVDAEAAIMSRYHDRAFYMRRHLAEATSRIAHQGYG